MTRAAQEAIGLVWAFRSGETDLALEAVATMDKVSLARLVGALAGLASVFLTTVDIIVEEPGIDQPGDQILALAVAAFANLAA